MTNTVTFEQLSECQAISGSIHFGNFQTPITQTLVAESLNSSFTISQNLQPLSLSFSEATGLLSNGSFNVSNNQVEISLNLGALQYLDGVVILENNANLVITSPLLFTTFTGSQITISNNAIQGGCPGPPQPPEHFWHRGHRGKQHHRHFLPYPVRHSRQLSIFGHTSLGSVNFQSLYEIPGSLEISNNRA